MKGEIAACIGQLCRSCASSGPDQSQDLRFIAFVERVTVAHIERESFVAGEIPSCHLVWS